MARLRNDLILDFEEVQKNKHKIKENGIIQFINIFNKKKNTVSEFSVGDEMELLLTADKRGRKVLTLVSEEMIECFNMFHGNIIEMLKSKDAAKKNNENPLLETQNNNIEDLTYKTYNKYQNIINTMKLPRHSKQELLYLLHYNLERISHPVDQVRNIDEPDAKISLIPEFSSYMLETIPLTVQKSDFKNFFTDMHRRISLISSLHKSFIPCSKVMLLTAFPMLYLDLEDLEQKNGLENSVFFDKKISTYDFSPKAGKLFYNITNSLFFPDNAINSHPRFSGLLRNMILRRKRQTEGYIATMTDQCQTHDKIVLLGRISNEYKSQSKESYTRDECQLQMEEQNLNNKNVSKKNMGDTDFYLENHDIGNEPASEHKDPKEKPHSNTSNQDFVEKSNTHGENAHEYTKISLEKESQNISITKSDENSENEKQIFVPSILIDSMGQGMGCTCIQFTYQLENLEIARFIYDQLTILAPILMRIMRSTPYSTNHLLNIDTRWEIISISVDDRTKEESCFDVEVKGLCKCGNCDKKMDCGYNFDSSTQKHDHEMKNIQISGEEEIDLKNPPQWAHIRRNMQKKTFTLATDKKNVKKSRYSPSDLFLHPWGHDFNDTEVRINEKYKQMLLDGNVDQLLANHVASLFERDPLIFYESQNTEDDQNIDRFDDFENIQSSNWRSTRFKIPIDDGWRVELRSLEIQPTVYENSNFAVFISSLVLWMIDEYKKAVLKNETKLFFYIPMSSVENNFSSASIFAHKESDYFDDNFDQNEKIFDEFYEKFLNSDKSQKEPLYYSFIANTTRTYKIKAPEDNIRFIYRDIQDEKIKRGTIQDIFVPICHLLIEKYPQYRNEIEFVKEVAQNKLVSTSDFLRYSLINDPDYVRGTSYINRSMTDRLIIKMDKIRKMDHWFYKKRAQQ